MSETHKSYLLSALKEASRFRGNCAPNPSVGALIVKKGKILSRGAHAFYGGPHAEAVALAAPGDWARGATAYVTLEPCSHFGKTPPCAELLIEKGIKKVVYGFDDPNPLVKGRGAERLREEGIEVEQLMLPEIEAFYESYAYWTRYKRPFVTAKLALSLDGKIAGPGGKRAKISEEALDRYTHQSRKQSDAILTTAKTLVADDPQLNVRLGPSPQKKKLYVIDRDLETPSHLRVFDSCESVTLFCGSEALSRASDLRAKTIGLPIQNNRFDWVEILEHLGEAGIHDLWVEAGGRCLLSLQAAGYLNRALFYVCPTWLGETAQSAFNKNEKALWSGRFTWRQIGASVVAEVRY